MGYRIVSSAGVELGTYEGETEREALDAMARDAGYASQADAEARGVAPFDGRILPTWCGECAAEGLDVSLGEIPAVDDEEAWGAWAAEHAAECPMIASRAGQRRAQG